MANLTWNMLRAAFGLIAALALADLPARAATVAQQTFAEPEAAAAALVAAAEADKPADLVRILGPAGKPLVYSGDPIADRQGREHFAAAYAEAHKLLPSGDGRAELVLSTKEWPFPIPLVKEGERWRFDTKAGAQEILQRRIGRNELDAIEVCRAYVDAQREYAAKGLSGGVLADYAQHFMSRHGKHDGLYWPVAAGEADSPMGPLVAAAQAEGYGKGSHGKREPYHGYYYRILKRQGANAPGGAYDYVVNGHMIGGFALIAYPAKWGDSGVMTFEVNQDGVVYQKNLGANTAAVAARITAFDPDGTWTKNP
ncbi:MAG TPA: DUF2950 domain-containing protein [Candidatus Cybelea sp.]|nr:DUF2950 domain-containing protein [Candidatus Cybelea sp.]